MNKRCYPDNAYKSIPKEYFLPNDKQGKVIRFAYAAKDYTNNLGEYEKTALVYLPYGYDENDKEKKYNVMYLSHGGADNENWYFGKVGTDSDTKNVLDNMMANGDVEPCIVCTPTYQNSLVDGVWDVIKPFHNELVNDLIPALETSFNTYFNGDLKATRQNRAMGGFSLGSAVTWWTFENRLDEIAYYMPISGDSWCVTQRGGLVETDATAEYMANIVRNSGWTKDDFIIYSGTGTKDIAYPNMTPMVEKMKTLTDAFVYCDNFNNGNFYYALREDGYHDQITVLNILYNGLPKMFG